MRKLIEERCYLLERTLERRRVALLVRDDGLWGVVMLEYQAGSRSAHRNHSFSLNEYNDAITAFERLCSNLIGTGFYLTSVSEKTYKSID